MLVQPGLVQARTRILEFNTGFCHAWQVARAQIVEPSPKASRDVNKQAVGLEEEEPRLKPATPLRDTGFPMHK